MDKYLVMMENNEEDIFYSDDELSDDELYQVFIFLHVFEESYQFLLIFMLCFI